MAKSTIQELRNQEMDILARREYHKKQINALTNELNNLRQKISYAERTQDQTPKGVLFEMFGKKVHELTPDELKEYNRIMQQKRREGL